MVFGWMWLVPPEGRSLEILDLRTLVPLDEELSYGRIRETNRQIVPHEGRLTIGFGTEIAARVSERNRRAGCTAHPRCGQGYFRAERPQS